MVLDGPAHCTLSVMTLIALAGPRGPRTGPEIAAELELPSVAVNRALRDLTAARLLTLDLEPARIGYATTRPPSDVTIAQIIEAAHPPDPDGPPSGFPAAGPVALSESKSGDNPGERARRGLMTALARITLSDVLHAQARRVGP